MNYKLIGKFDKPITSQSTDDNVDVPVAGKSVNVSNIHNIYYKLENF